MIYDDFRAFVEEEGLLADGDRVLIALSGGPDSMALCDLLCRLREDRPLNLVAVHLNHQLRPGAGAEALAVASYCRQQKVPFIYATCRVADLARREKIGEEAAGRQARHQLFQQVMARWKLTKLALGHHADDRAETILLNMIRGAGVQGMAAMPAQRGALIRPLLFARKDQLVQYCQEKGIPFAVDETNADTGYSRNRVRHDLVPILEDMNPAAVRHINRMADHLQEVDRLVADHLVTPLMDQASSVIAGEIAFPRASLQGQPTYVQKTVLNRLRKVLSPREGTFNAYQLNTIIDVLNSLQNDKIIDGGWIKVYIEKTHIVLSDATQQGEAPFLGLWQPRLGDKLRLASWPGALFAGQPAPAKPSLWDLCLREDSPLWIRYRQAGDLIQRPGLGHQALKKVFQAHHIPQRLRARWPIICDQTGQVMWIPGLAKSDKAVSNEKNHAKTGIYIKALFNDLTTH